MHKTTNKTKPEAVKPTANCHNSPQEKVTGLPLVAIVGSPNVGKSVLFNTLTGIYATVSNYPGTTVEVTRGKARVGEFELGVVDTPGMYSLLPITEEERVAQRILLHEKPSLVLHVVDAKNLIRMLPMTLQLIEAGLPLILVVNLLDEADRIGMQIDLNALQEAIGTPVVGTALTFGRGVEALKTTIIEIIASQTKPANEKTAPAPLVRYPSQIQDGLDRLKRQINGSYTLSNHAMAVLLLQQDEETQALVDEQEGENAPALHESAEQTRSQFSQPLALLIAQQHQLAARGLLSAVINIPETHKLSLASRLSDWMIHPLSGLPFLFLILILLYLFVGVFGAQTLVGWMEETLFGQWINPWVDQFLANAIPWDVLRQLVGGEFGILTLGFRYAIAIVLPIVGTFFLAFSIIEDSGYLPRLSLLIDRLFKKIGLNGRAVIPMVLGFGCDTMATIVTRTLETRRERLISTLLLSLAIPCSAQLGVMLALLGLYPKMAMVWIGVVVGVFLLVGYLAAQLMPGEKPSFYMELPPLRIPTPGNVLLKTYTRMEWYLREVIPLFVAASVLIWLGNLTGLFDLALAVLKPIVTWLGLPQESAVAFLFGFFRRDYGAAGLYDLRHLLSPAQLAVAVTTMTLFVPCVAQFAVMVKERGWKTSVGIALFIVPFALLVGGGMHAVFTLMGVN